MNRISALIALVAGVFLFSSTAALAADPTQADFDTCNRVAQSKTSNPSASPKENAGATPATGADTAAKPGSPVSPSAAPASKTPATPSPAPTPRADTGTKPGTPVSPSSAPAMETPATPSPAATTGAPSTGNPTGGRVTDSTQPGVPAAAASDEVRGMAAAGQTDPAFRHAYMECMKGRGF